MKEPNKDNQKGKEQMKKFLNALMLMAVLFVGVSANAAVKKPNVFGGGLILASPESFGFYGTYFPDTAVSIDGWATLSTIDAGVTGHFKMFEGETGIHSIIGTGMAGYVHELVANDDLVKGSPHFVLAGGYGWRSHGGWDFRAQLGMQISKNRANQTDSDFHSHILLGHTF